MASAVSQAEQFWAELCGWTSPNLLTTILPISATQCVTPAKAEKEAIPYREKLSAPTAVLLRSAALSGALAGKERADRAREAGEFCRDWTPARSGDTRETHQTDRESEGE